MGKNRRKKDEAHLKNRDEYIRWRCENFDPYACIYRYKDGTLSDVCISDCNECDYGPIKNWNL